MRLEIDLSLPIYCDWVTIMRKVANQITPLRKWNPAAYLETVDGR